MRLNGGINLFFHVSCSAWREGRAAMCAGRVAACEVFWGLGFRKIPSGAAVVVQAPKTCQYYFSKFIKMFSCVVGAESASKQILNFVRLTPSTLAMSLLSTSKMPGERGQAQ